MQELGFPVVQQMFYNPERVYAGQQRQRGPLGQLSSIFDQPIPHLKNTLTNKVEEIHSVLICPLKNNSNLNQGN